MNELNFPKKPWRFRRPSLKRQMMASFHSTISHLGAPVAERGLCITQHIGTCRTATPRQLGWGTGVSSSWDLHVGLTVGDKALSPLTHPHPWPIRSRARTLSTHLLRHCWVGCTGSGHSQGASMEGEVRQTGPVSSLGPHWSKAKSFCCIYYSCFSFLYFCYCCKIH